MRNLGPNVSRWSGRRAFSLLEVLIVVLIIAMLGALVVPQFSSAARSAKESSLRDDLNYLRSQILVYRAQHQGISPGYPAGDPTAQPDYDTFVAQMTLYSDAAGRTATAPSAGFKFGPYLTSVPQNVINGSAKIRFLGAGDFASAPQGGEGWVFQPSSGIVVANVPGRDAAGMPFFDY